MTRKRLHFATSVLLVLIAAAGCAPRYMITQPLTQPLVLGETVRVGEILDEMPADTEEGDRPTAENLLKFRSYLADEISKRGDLPLEVLPVEAAYPGSDTVQSDNENWEFGDEASETTPEATAAPAQAEYSQAPYRYEITGSILGYKAGSGFLRFMIGFGAGSAKMLTHLELRDTTNDQTIFGGNFEGTVKSWAESGSEMFKRVARDFSKELEKQFKSPGQQAETSMPDDSLP